jgi:hypothetical protein
LSSGRLSRGRCGKERNTHQYCERNAEQGHTSSVGDGERYAHVTKEAYHRAVRRFIIALSLVSAGAGGAGVEPGVNESGSLCVQLRAGQFERPALSGNDVHVQAAGCATAARVFYFVRTG